MHARVMRKEAVNVECKVALMAFNLCLLESAAFVKHGRVAKANPAGTGRMAQRIEQCILDRVATRIAVQVVKLGDGGIAGLEHFLVGLLRDCSEQRRIDRAGQRIHALAPRPEAVFTGRRSFLGPAGQGSLKCMAVGIAESRNDDTGDDVGLLRAGVHGNAFNAPGINAKADIVCPAFL